MQSWNFEVVLGQRANQTICFDQIGGSYAFHCSSPCKIWFCLSCTLRSTTNKSGFHSEWALAFNTVYGQVVSCECTTDYFGYLLLCSADLEQDSQLRVTHRRVGTVGLAQRKSEYITFKHSSNHQGHPHQQTCLEKVQDDWMCGPQKQFPLGFRRGWNNEYTIFRVARCYVAVSYRLHKEYTPRTWRAMLRVRRQ